MKMTCLLNIAILRANETDTHTKSLNMWWHCDCYTVVVNVECSREKRNRFYFYDFWYGNNNDNDNDDDDEYERFIYDANTSAQWLSFSYQTNRHG